MKRYLKIIMAAAMSVCIAAAFTAVPANAASPMACSQKVSAGGSGVICVSSYPSLRTVKLYKRSGGTWNYKCSNKGTRDSASGRTYYAFKVSKGKYKVKGSSKGNLRSARFVKYIKSTNAEYGKAYFCAAQVKNTALYKFTAKYDYTCFGISTYNGSIALLDANKKTIKSIGSIEKYCSSENSTTFKTTVGQTYYAKLTSKMGNCGYYAVTFGRGNAGDAVK